MTPMIPKDLARDPELAAIEILDAVLDATIRALIAAHPELADDHSHQLPPHPSCHVASPEATPNPSPTYQPLRWCGGRAKTLEAQRTNARTRRMGTRMCFMMAAF